MYRQDESIYALIPPEEMEQAKPPMYAPRNARRSRWPWVLTVMLIFHSHRSLFTDCRVTESLDCVPIDTTKAPGQLVRR